MSMYDFCNQRGAKFNPFDIRNVLCTPYRLVNVAIGDPAAEQYGLLRYGAVPTPDTSMLPTPPGPTLSDAQMGSTGSGSWTPEQAFASPDALSQFAGQQAQNIQSAEDAGIYQPAGNTGFSWLVIGALALVTMLVIRKL